MKEIEKKQEKTMAKKGIRTLLICWNRWGYRCHRQVYDTKTEAQKEARWLKENGYAFSSRIIPNYTGG